MKKICFTIYDMGGGHRSTANALNEVIRERKLPWQVQIVEVFKEVFGTSMPQFMYNNWVLKKNWAKAINDPISVPLFKQQIRFRHGAWRDRLQRYWREQQPDMVVSLMPLVNRVLYESLQRELPDIPFVTFMTDFADCPPHFWIEPQPQLLICPSQRAMQQARACGYAEENLFQTSGVVIQPRFGEYQHPSASQRAVERKRLGLDLHLPTGFVIFGTQGSDAMIEITERLERSSLDLQLIFVCGRNQKLAEQLQKRSTRFPKLVLGFTKDIPYYMSLSDFFIGKPGSVGISEAIAMNLPVIIECNQRMTMFQERASGDWLVSNDFGIVIESVREIEPAVRQLIDPQNFSRYRANVQAYENRASFEVVDILENILKSSATVEMVARANK